MSAVAVFANSAEGLKAVFDLLAVLFGGLILLASAGLGALAWFKVFRPPGTALGLLGRSLVALAAVVAFLVGGLLLVSGLDSNRLENPLAAAVLLLALVFLVVECFVAGRLYRSAAIHRPSPWTRALSIASYGIGGLLALSTALVLVLVALSTLLPDSAPRGDSAEVRRYAEGCDRSNASDCNMLGLRRQAGDGTPRAPEAAASAFSRACELGAAIGCQNLAALNTQRDAAASAAAPASAR